MGLLAVRFMASFTSTLYSGFAIFSYGTDTDGRYSGANEVHTNPETPCCCALASMT